MANTAVSTPEQQAAFADLSNGWMRQRIIEGIAATGTVEDAAPIIGLSPRTVYYWMAKDDVFAGQVEQAKVRCSEKLLGKSVAAWLTATPEELRKAGVSFIAVMNWLDKAKRPNAITINNDNRTQNAILMAPEQLEHLSALYMKTARQHDSASYIEGAEGETE